MERSTEVISHQYPRKENAVSPDLLGVGHVLMVVVAFVISVPCMSPALPLEEHNVHETLLKGIDLTLKQDYPEAKALFESVTRNEPENPAAYLYLAAVLQAEYSDYELSFDQQLFDSLIAKGETLAEHLIESKDSADWGYYYAGSALSYRAYSESETGSWSSVIIDGMNAAEMYERCLEINPQFYDAMNGLGTYYYWRSKKTEFLSWLPFLSNKERKGIDLLSLAAARGTFEKFVAVNSLTLVYMEEKQYDSAFSVVQKGLESYPDNRAFLWCLMGIVENMPHQDTALVRSVVSIVLASVLHSPVRNQYSEAACRLKLAQYAMEDRHYKAAIEECDAIVRYEPFVGKTKRDIGKKVKAAKVILEQAKELVNSEKLKVKS